MLANVYSAGLIGLNACLFSVQVDECNGLPRSIIVGNVSPSVREGLERAIIALKNNGFDLPPKKITINIQPADVRKNGTSFDFAILAGMFIATNVKENPYQNYAFLGELGLDGEIKHIPGVLPMTLAMEEAGIEGVFVGKEDEKEALHCKKLKIIALSCVREWIKILYPFLIKKPSLNSLEMKLKGSRKIEVKKSCISQNQMKKICMGFPLSAKDNKAQKEIADFSDISGQEAGIRACVIAASGMHAILFSGPAGSGKSMLARRIPGILPKLSEEEKLEVSKIYSIAGDLSGEEGLLQERPFRAPHTAISQNTLLGGMVGGNLVPGELALATKGVLFLDELPLFRKETIEALRSPLEEKEVVLHRLHQVFSYKVDCILVAAMNPCPCGFFPDRNRCHCTPGQIRAYQRGISKPILERIDISLELPPVPLENALGKEKKFSSEELSKQVIEARRRQKERFKAEEYIDWNSQMGPSELEKYCFLGKKEEDFMKKVFALKNLSMRTYHKVLKVARTVADVEGKENITIEHLAEAVSYRIVEENLY